MPLMPSLTVPGRAAGGLLYQVPSGQLQMQKLSSPRALGGLRHVSPWERLQGPSLCIPPQFQPSTPDVRNARAHVSSLADL